MTNNTRNSSGRVEGRKTGESAKSVIEGLSTVNPFVFVLMPFHPDFDDVYQLGIKAACISAGAYCERVDEQIFVENILERVYDQIAKADIIVSEMTGRNTNVFYETGYAHALNKRVILLTQNADDIPFDLKQYPHIVYGGKITNLKTELEKRISWCIENPTESIAGESLSENSPIIVSRSELPALDERGQNSKEIIIVGATLYSALIPNLDFFEHKMRQGCKLRFMLLDPESSAIETLQLINKVSNQKIYIEQSLNVLNGLIAMNNTTKGKCEVRLSPVLLSFGMAGFDIGKKSGYINIEFYTYKTLGEIPNITLKRNSNQRWFEHFTRQFELAWEDSKVLEKRA